MRVYATPEEYNTFAEQAITGGVLQKRLRDASIEVDALTRLSVYAVDDNDMPADTKIREAFTAATCAIVEHWALTGDPWGIEAAEGAVKIGSVTLGTTSSSSDSLDARERLARRIGSRALDILTTEGLITALVGSA